ncbi:hypothetical protein G6F46_001020 [Rhizopus delemar]|uniref:Uncharacterized protein n=3 Tax=Rhizopus TaxID=4842 RepID=I1C3N6_RHIO9|nr:hypothetical protein RO3G_07771 [Rhizopus delemar RA 99-880]KAG1463336.1 hypothetical protein G6F55_002450 [Rhizopus delemar]KAG1553446.1 hypothetical protein G6F51_000594 [Rhizopus arrhizus]KAG1501346.1 hypothetical protein G6F54_003105 [Rhizopus delemar]KAG1518225.1 hypothetical protein G6F53_000754 [Rhizopus delemar]|eukprot:EIE83066.1 hypothetical protein RO3G_07771 [Rhizopus delemar RA 99-880]
MSSSKSDPRRPDNVVPFHLPRRNEEEEDWSQMLATLVAMGAIMTRNRYKIVPWIAAYFGFTSVLNSRKSLKAKDSIASSGVMLAAVSLFTFYMNLYLSHKRSLEAVANGDIVIVDAVN